MSEVRAAHLLIKHSGSRNPISRRTNKETTISKDEAIASLQKLRTEIVSSSDPAKTFQDLATARSDCSSYKRGGDLGPFGRGQMQRPFEEATYALKIGEISDIVDTDSGVHVILRLPL
uniref:Peptidyl-prolyl cis-trans isomerase n=1 Tax=Aureoumbra lagunensis TaxID=44058 RepID=A0A7S3JWB8_9STRA|mmetsp:Transcript_10410/g.15717  ORF Transcript_10410/g.15717 Transcript_10410/m.15717 type:complete len:118 (+) Transcript_10410:65-418(+)